MRGYIYKLYTNDQKQVYYGSTSQRVCKRIADHNTDYKQWLKGKRNFVYSFPIIATNDYTYETLEYIDYNEKFELKQRERWYIQNNDCVNKQIPNQTEKEYRDTHRDEITEYKKEYYIDNKDKLLEYQTQYHIDNKDKILEYKKQYYIDNKDKLSEYQAQYNATHKEEYNEYQAQYYIENKDKLLEVRRNDIVKCDCGTCVRADGLSRHKNSKKHKEQMSNLENIIRIP